MLSNLKEKEFKVGGEKEYSNTSASLVVKQIMNLSLFKNKLYENWYRDV